MIVLETDILKSITKNLNVLPDSQKALGEYILVNYKEAASLSALELGAKVGVSDATVVRFAKSLGYSGYVEIKKELFKCLTKEDIPSEKMLKSLEKIREVDSAVADVFQNDINNIQKTLKSFCKEKLDDAVRTLHQASIIYILGFNSCGPLAGFLNFHLQRLSLKVQLITSAGLVMYEQLAFISKEDALVVISYPRYSVDSLNAANYAKSRGAKVVSITDKSYSPIAEASNIPLIAHSTSPGFYNSYAAATTICNVLVLSVALLNKERYLKALKTMDEIQNDGLYI